MHSSHFFRLTTAHGNTMEFFLESCALLFKDVYGGTIEHVPMELFKST